MPIPRFPKNRVAKERAVLIGDPRVAGGAAAGRDSERLVSHENVEMHRRALEAFNAGDLEAFVALWDPEIEFHSTFAAVGGARYHGHDGLRRWHRDLEDAWGDGIRVELD